MKVIILVKGEMLSNLIEGTLDAKCEIAGVFRYERTIMPELLLSLRDFFKISPSCMTIIGLMPSILTAPPSTLPILPP